MTEPTCSATIPDGPPDGLILYRRRRCDRQPTTPVTTPTGHTVHRCADHIDQNEER